MGLSSLTRSFLFYRLRRWHLCLARLKEPCTFLGIAKGRLVGFWKNKKDALSTSPQAGFLDGSQSLWALWATPSSELHREGVSCCVTNSAALPGAPSEPLRLESPRKDPRPGEAGR